MFVATPTPPPPPPPPPQPPGPLPPPPLARTRGVLDHGDSEEADSEAGDPLHPPHHDRLLLLRPEGVGWARDSDLNPDIRVGVPDIVSDIMIDTDSDIGNVMPDIEASNHDIGAPPISGLISEAWNGCSEIGVYGD